MKVVKKVLSFVMVVAITLGGVSVREQQASAKTVSKVSKIITLTKKNRLVGQKLLIRSKEKVSVKVKILGVSGTVTEKKNNLYFGEYECSEGKGSFWMPYPEYKLSKKSFKKGKVLVPPVNLSDMPDGYDYVTGKTGVDWRMPKGLTSLKLQVTYYTKSGRAGINFVKTTYNKSAVD